MNVFKIVWLELLNRKSQFISGILSITLGIAVIVAIQSISTVSRENVARKLDNLGANILVLPQGASIDDYYTSDIDAPTIPGEYVERILNSTLKGVDNMSPKLTRRVKVGENTIVLTGILPKSEIASKPLWQGIGLIGTEVKTACAPAAPQESLKYLDERLQRKVVDTLQKNECLLGYQAAKRLNLKEKETLSVLNTELTVVRILPETGTVDDDRVFAHLTTVQAMTGIPDQISAIEIMGCCHAISEGLLSKLRNILPDTRITTINQIVSTQIETNRLMNKVSLVFLIIIFFVGSVSMGNFMWANVNERRKEIGILRMMGASKKIIYQLFIYKSIVLGVVGGIAGFVLGTLAGVFLGPFLADMAVRPVYLYLLWSLLLSVIIGIAGAVIPASMAAKIDPHTNLQEA
ncbi:MAG: ABC transporter permease [Bacteroidales bacterium]|nr:ABC transporter permease [Bacteroidales bacterium]